MFQNLLQIYTQADAVQVCGKFWDTQYKSTYMAIDIYYFPVKKLKLGIMSYDITYARYITSKKLIFISHFPFKPVKQTNLQLDI